MTRKPHPNWTEEGGSHWLRIGPALTLPLYAALTGTEWHWCHQNTQERGVADTLDAAKLAAEDSMLAHARLVVETLRPWIVAPSEPPPYLDLETLDPGIRRLVSLLREAGFDTCDSGDGSKAPAMECALDVPMVAIEVSRESAIVTAEAVHGLLVLATKPGVLEREGIAVDLSYSPRDRTAIVVILGVSDTDLKSGVAVHRSTR